MVISLHETAMRLRDCCVLWRRHRRRGYSSWWRSTQAGHPRLIWQVCRCGCLRQRHLCACRSTRINCAVTCMTKGTSTSTRRSAQCRCRPGDACAHHVRHMHCARTVTRAHTCVARLREQRVCTCNVTQHLQPPRHTRLRAARWRQHPIWWCWGALRGGRVKELRRLWRRCRSVL